MISQIANLKNPFVINTLTINGMDVSDHFVEMKIEEDIFATFIKGSIKLSNLILVIPNTWTDPQLGFLNREIEIEWNTDVTQNKNEYKKNIKCIIYSIAEETESYIKLSFIQKGYFNYLTKQFCDGWNNKSVISIIDDIFKNYVFDGILPTFDFGSDSDTISFTNPNWTPIKAIKFLLPMISNSYFLYSSTSGNLVCKSINDLLKQKSSENLKLTLLEKDNDKNLSEIIDFQVSTKSNNILEQIYNNIHGITLVEYNPFTKLLNTTNINNNIKNIKQLGSENNLVSDYDGTSLRIDFAFSNNNQSNVESNLSIYDFFKNNQLMIYIMGLSSRNLGSIIDIDLSIKNRFLYEQRHEIGGKNLITSIIHAFTKTQYIQKLKLVKPGLDTYTEKIPI